MDIFRLDPGGLWSRWEEVHEEYAYEPAELEELLRQAGFPADQTIRRAEVPRPQGGGAADFLCRTKGILTSMADKIIRVLAKDAPVKASGDHGQGDGGARRQIHKTLPWPPRPWAAA